MYEIKYRDKSEFISTNVMWMNKLPQDWKFASVKHFYKFSTGGTPSSGREEYYDDNGHKWATISDLKGKNIEDTKTKITLKGINSCSMKLNKKGSLLYSFKLSVGQVAFLEDDMYTNEAIATFNTSDKYSLGYLYYSAPLFIIENANENIYGAKLLNQDLIKNAKTLFPNIDEQQKIANFLDIKTAKFDYIIAKKELLIKKLEEAKKSLISEVVTGKVKIVDGQLVPRDTSEMKDSGIEWIGKVPQDWALSMLKYHCKTVKGYAFKSDLFKGEGIPIIKTTDIKNNTIMPNETFIDKKFFSRYKKVELHEDDIVMSTVGSNPEVVNSAVGQIARIPKEFEGALLNQNAVMLRNIGEDTITDYLYLVMSSWKYRKYLDLNAHGTANQSSLSLKEILGYSFAYPNKSEQEKIIKYVEKYLNGYNNTISKCTKQMEIINQAKQALISEAVTGKIDLRDWEIIEEGELQ